MKSTESMYSILVLTEHSFFHLKDDKRSVNDSHTISLINEFLENGIFVEVEEILDCATGSFYRSKEEIFDLVVYVSTNSINEFWGNISNNCQGKIKQYRPIIDYWQQIIDVANDEIAIPEDIISLIGLEVSKLSDVDITEVYLQKLKSALKEREILRAEMLMRVLSNVGNLNVSNIIECLVEHPGINEILVRILPIFNIPEYEEIPGLLQEHIDSETMTILLNISLLHSKLEQEHFGTIINSSSTRKELARNLFVEATSKFSGSIFLNIINTEKKVGTVSDALLIKENWIEDLELLNHWTIISPNEHDSWLIYSRKLWDLGLMVECAEVATRGLIHHPESANLLRIKAHGHREQYEHRAAVEIEKRLLGKHDLVTLDTLVYLCRSLCALEDWEQAWKYIRRGLQIKSEHQELIKKKNLVLEKLPEIDKIFSELQISESEHDVSEENWPQNLLNLMFFTPNGLLASHEYNDGAGRKIIQHLLPGDILVVKQTPYCLELTVKNINLGRGGNPTIELVEAIPQEVLDSKRTNWKIGNVQDLKRYCSRNKE